MNVSAVLSIQRTFQAWAVFAILGFSTLACAQYSGNAAAKVAFEQGEKARESDNYAEAVTHYQKAISLDPDFAQAHEQYLLAQRRIIIMPYITVIMSGKKPTPEQEATMRAESKKLTDSQIHDYEALVAQHPDKAVYRWALGSLYNESNPLRQEEYCRQSIHIDPKFAPGYDCLSAVANLRGDEKQAAEYLRKVMDLEPDDVTVAFSWAFMQQNDPVAYQAATMELIKRFPNAPQSAQALYWYAIHQKTDAAKIENFEQLYKQFPPAKFDWSGNGASDLFGLYDKTDPAKAQAFAHKMLSADPKDKDWIAFSAYADAMAKAEQQGVEDKNPTAALATLELVKAPGRQFDMRRKELLQARVLDLNGKPGEAFAMLLSSYAKHPTDEIRDALVEYGAKTGKSSTEVSAAIWSAVTANSTPAIPFSLPNFTDDKQVSLASYQGHVVIVDFWYPNCGPCRASFPYLQQIASKYKDKGVVLLAINGEEGQEAFVLPLLKNKGYDFLPLKGTNKWASDVYHVRGYPTTFLIGVDGRQYFSPHVYNDLEERAAEMEIEELLAHSGQ
jgi:thiol-disulfide isomerase/thioredoxin